LPIYPDEKITYTKYEINAKEKIKIKRNEIIN
jgi:hypothetical protein